jgi:hypothetical protein
MSKTPTPNATQPIPEPGVPNAAQPVIAISTEEVIQITTDVFRKFQGTLDQHVTLQACLQAITKALTTKA